MNGEGELRLKPIKTGIPSHKWYSSTGRSTSLRRGLNEFLKHYHYERNHQGTENLLLFTAPTLPQRLHRPVIHSRQSLGGLLKFYQRVA